MNEEEPLKPTKYMLGSDLSDLSVEELQKLIEELKNEVERIEAAKNSKSAHLNAAQALFKS